MQQILMKIKNKIQNNAPKISIADVIPVFSIASAFTRYQ